MPRSRFLCFASLIAGTFASFTALAFSQTLHWKPLAQIPDREGFAAPFVGISHGSLIVAGGANFPGKRPWEGGQKVWHDSAFILEKPDDVWKQGFKLPRALAYGVPITTDQGIVCIGGSDSHKHSADVFLLRWENHELKTSPLPSLPKPCANLCGALVGHTIYVAGGLENADSTKALHTFLALDLHALEQGWKTLQTWPGPERMLATAASQNGTFYLFSGASLKTGTDGKPVREWLRDAFAFTPEKGWKRLADLPRPAIAAPSPAPLLGENKLLILGGDDGAQVNVLPTAHLGFPRNVLAFDCTTQTWSELPEMPFSLVTTSAVFWQNQIVIPGGEARPGLRSTDVWSGKITP